MRVRIQDGMPIDDDMVAALEAFSDTKHVEVRQEIYLNQCPFCGSTDNRGNGVQGAISYSLRIHCLTCAKCGESHGWVETLEALRIETERAGPSASQIASRMRVVKPKKAEEDRQWVDHGDHGESTEVQAQLHVNRLMAKDSKVRAWLETRGFIFDPPYAEDLKRCWAGECAAGWLVMIYWDEDGSLRGFKYRHIETKEFSAQKGVQARPYGIHRIDPSVGALVIVEGELDCETLRIHYGVKNVISLPNGNNSWKDDWCKYLAHTDTLYIATDNDEAGEKACRKIMESLPEHAPTVTQIKRVVFRDGAHRQCKDANEALMGGPDKQHPASLDKIRSCFEEADHITLVSSERAEMNTTGRFISSGHSNWDLVQGGGFLTGEVTHIAGPPKSGKTTLMADIHQNLSQRGIKNGFLPLDMSTKNLVIRIGMNLLCSTDAEFYRTDVGSEERQRLMDKMTAAMKEKHRGNFILAKDDAVLTYKGAMAVLDRMAKSGCKVITVEDYLSLASLYEVESKGKVSFAGKRIIVDLSEVAKRNSCHIILINHLKDSEGAYGASQLGAVAQSNNVIEAVRDEIGSVKFIRMHVKDSRLCSQSDVYIDFQFASTDRILVASSPKRAQKTKKPSAKRLPSSEARDAGIPF